MDINAEKGIKSLEFTLKLLGLISAIAYVLGFIVFSVFHYDYGIDALEIVSSKYILSGFIFIILSVPSFLTYLILYKSIQIHVSIKYIILCALALLCLYYTGDLADKNIDNIYRLRIGSAITFYITVVLFFHLIYLTLTTFNQKHFTLFAFITSTTLILFFWCILLFTVNIYRSIPASLGGGKPRGVNVSFKDIAVLQNWGIPQFQNRTDSHYSDKVYLVFETESTYYIALTANYADIIEIPKEITNGAQIAR